MSFDPDHGQARAGRLVEAFFQTTTGSPYGGIIDQDAAFCETPTQYEWSCKGKQEMLVPYNCRPEKEDSGDNAAELAPYPPGIRWEKHRVWILEGLLRRGESNVLVRRRFYLDEDSWAILLGEGYDVTGKMAKCYMLHNSVAAEKPKGRWYPT